MAKYTIEDIYRGDKYSIESDVFVEALRRLQNGEPASVVKSELNKMYIKHTLLTLQKMKSEGDCISDNEVTIVF